MSTGIPGCPDGSSERASVRATPSSLKVLGSWPTLPISAPSLQQYVASAITADVGYGLGSKCPGADIGRLPIPYSRIDCSGFIRCVIAAATRERVMMPDGSYIQNDWCAERGFKRSVYANAALEDGHWRLCFHRPNSEDEIGHVWLVHNGVTTESYGGHGPGHRAWSSPVLLALATDVYVVA